MKPRTKKQKFNDNFTAFQQMKAGKDVVRMTNKDGSLTTTPTVPCPDVLEGEVLADCLAWLKGRGIMCDRLNNGKGCIGFSATMYQFGIKGGGDILGILPSGQHFEIECKRGRGGNWSEEQRERCRRVMASNGKYWVVHGVPELEVLLNPYISTINFEAL